MPSPSCAAVSDESSVLATPAHTRRRDLHSLNLELVSRIGKHFSVHLVALVETFPAVVLLKQKFKPVETKLSSQAGMHPDQLKSRFPMSKFLSQHQ
jgi:hypothetical protein